MNKKPTPLAVIKTSSVTPLLKRVRALVQTARNATAGAVDTLQVLTNFEIGRLIVEHEQQGRQRAEYGKETLKILAIGLTREFGRGFSQRNLEYFRKFYLIWRSRMPEISQKASAKSDRRQIPLYPGSSWRKS